VGTLRKLFRNRVGVSPVVASVILAAAAIATGIATLYWASSALDIKRSESDVFFFSRIESVKESLVVEDVWFYEFGGVKYVNVTVRNVGTVDLEVVSVYLNESKAWDGSVGVEVGEAVTVKAEFSWDEGTYQIAVVTARGNKVESSCTA